MDIKIFLSVIQLLLTSFGVFFGIYLYRVSLKEKKQAFIFNIYDKLYSDTEIREVLYAADKKARELDSLKEKLEVQNIETVYLEKELDKTLRYFDYIGLLLKNKHLNQKDLDVFQYEIKEVLTNPIIEKYIEHLKHLRIPLQGLEEIDNYLKKGKK